MLCLFIHIRECTKVFLKSLLSAWIQHLGKHRAAQRQGWLFPLSCDCTRLYHLTALGSATNWFLFQYLQHHRTIQPQILQQSNHEIFCLNSLVATISHTVHRSILMHIVTADCIHIQWTQKAPLYSIFSLSKPERKFSFSTDHRRSLKLLCS